MLQIERSQTQNGHGPLLEDPSRNFELSFEYLISKDNLKWVTLRTEHATFISVCLQVISFIEMLLTHNTDVKSSSSKINHTSDKMFLFKKNISQRQPFFNILF